VRTAVSPGRARPSGPKLSVLFRSSYALTFKPCAGRLTGVAAASVERRSTTRWDAAARYARAPKRRGISYIGEASQPDQRTRRDAPATEAAGSGGRGQHPQFFSQYRISRSIPHRRSGRW
jgi:hypothetical protein